MVELPASMFVFTQQTIESNMIASSLRQGIHTSLSTRNIVIGPSRPGQPIMMHPLMFLMDLHTPKE